jgi:hypothetical protein
MADLSEMEIRGTAYAHGMQARRILLSKTQIGKDAVFYGVHVEELDFSAGSVGGKGLFYDMHADNASFAGTQIRSDADFQRARIKRLNVQDLQVGGVLSLEDAVIDVCEGTTGLVVGAYSLNERTKIPADLKRALQQYKLRVPCTIY